jgi:hypothetical protein
MTDIWLHRLADAMDVEPLGDDEMEALLALARDVAHRVERKVTPLAAFLLGMGVARQVARGHGRREALERASADLGALLPKG